MKILNIYVTKVFTFMDNEGYFKGETYPDGENHQVFIRFARNLGYPEFGLRDGVVAKDFSYLPKSELIDFNDLDENILLELPRKVSNYIKDNIPDLYHQINITLAMKDFVVNESITYFLSSLIEYLKYLSEEMLNSSEPKQRDYDFLNYVIDFILNVKNFKLLQENIDRGYVQNKQNLWQYLILEILSLNIYISSIFKFAVQLILKNTKYEFIPMLQKKIVETDFKGALSEKVIKNIQVGGSSFIEISSNSVYFSVNSLDLTNSNKLDFLLNFEIKIRGLYPEIDVFFLNEHDFYQRRVLYIGFSSLDEWKKKTLNSIFSLLLDPNKNFTLNEFNDVLNKMDYFLTVSNTFKNSGLGDGICEDINKV